MANYPQLDNASGVWNLREVYDAVMGGYWPNANSKGLVAGGTNAAPYLKGIDSFTMASSGNASNFGDLTTARFSSAGMGSFTRAVFGGGYTGSNSDVLDYVTFSTEGNAADF